MRKIFIDCTQNIPCDPCQHACAFGAIHIGENITDLPVTDSEKCTGCGICVAACPGQACFLVDEDFAPDRATLDFPYEYLPYPVEGMEVTACDNEGTSICTGIVEKVILNKRYNKTAIIRMSVPREHVYKVRGMKRIKE